MLHSRDFCSVAIYLNVSFLRKTHSIFHCSKVLCFVRSLYDRPDKIAVFLFVCFFLGGEGVRSEWYPLTGKHREISEACLSTDEQPVAPVPPGGVHQSTRHNYFLLVDRFVTQKLRDQSPFSLACSFSFFFLPSKCLCVLKNRRAKQVATYSAKRVGILARANQCCFPTMLAWIFSFLLLAARIRCM